MFMADTRPLVYLGAVYFGCAAAQKRNWQTVESGSQGSSSRRAIEKPCCISNIQPVKLMQTTPVEERLLVLLNVYDVASPDTGSRLALLNSITRPLGGVFHGAVQLGEVEYSYGYCERGSGVYAVQGAALQARSIVAAETTLWGRQPSPPPPVPPTPLRTAARSNPMYSYRETLQLGYTHLTQEEACEDADF